MIRLLPAEQAGPAGPARQAWPARHWLADVMDQSSEYWTRPGRAEDEHENGERELADGHARGDDTGGDR